jgi:hypothetical protein
MNNTDVEELAEAKAESIDRLDQELAEAKAKDEPKIKVNPKTNPERDERGRKFLNNAPTKVAYTITAMLGMGELAGVFHRGDELVHTPRFDETGYVPPKIGDDGPAQVRVLNERMLKTLAELAYNFGYEDTKTDLWVETLAPASGIAHAYDAGLLGMAPNLRQLRGATHTPILLPDGRVLDQPGYDLDSRTLYLPEPGLTVPPIPDKPSAEEVKAALAMVLELVAEFPFVAEDHRANWLGLLFTPIMRALIPPPYQGGLITAPDKGSGKSLLAWIIGKLHGRVFRPGIPGDGDEQRKTIASILMTTTAPVIVLDNVRGVVRSAALEALLTSDMYSDRVLGVLKDTPPLFNDRVWLITGNNAQIGGDLGRRVLPVEIDPEMPDPHTRSFKLDLYRHVPAHRGELLAALLTLGRAWYVAGSPPDTVGRTDDYGRWYMGISGLLKWLEVPGQFGLVEASSIAQDPDAEEWAGLCEAIYDGFKSADFTVKELAQALSDGKYDPLAKVTVNADALPQQLAEKFDKAYTQTSVGIGSYVVRKNDQGFKQTLGWWFKNHAGRYAHGWHVENRGGNAARQKWCVIAPRDRG